MSAEKKCPNCGEVLPGGAKFCMSCGTRMPTAPVESREAKPEKPKKNKRSFFSRIIIILAAAVVGYSISSSACMFGHKWTLASCSAPMTCSRCGITQGTKLGHNWVNGTDTIPTMCVNCGDMQPLDRPKSGEVFIGKGKSLGSTFRAINTSSLDCYIIMKDASYNEVYSFYVRANEEKYVPVPAGDFYIYIAQGSEWYGPDNGFDSGIPIRDSELLDFNNLWYTYTIN